MSTHGSHIVVRTRSMRSLFVVAFVVAATLVLAPPSLADSAQVSITTPADGSTITNSRANLSFAVTGATMTLLETRTYCLVDGSPGLAGWGLPCSPDWPNELRLTNGTHRLDVFAWDGPANVAHASSTFTVSDTVAPSLSITRVPDVEPVTGPVQFSILIGGTASATCRIDSQPAVPCDGIMSNADPTTGEFSPESLANGAHTLFATATDPAGNATTASHNFTVDDTTAPALSIASPAPGATITTSPLGLRFQLDDRSALVECKIDGGSYSDCVGGELYCEPGPDPTCGTRLLGLTNGAHTISMRATDITGNVSPEQSVSFTVNDTTPPAVDITAPADGAVIDGSAGEGVSAQFGSPNPGKYDCSTDAQAYVPCMEHDDWYSAMTMWGWPGTPVESNGAHTLGVRVSDPMGRTAVDAVGFTVDDQTPPSAYLVWPKPSANVTSPITVVVGGPDSPQTHRCEFRLDSASFQPCDSNPGLHAIAASPGSHTIHIRWRDWVGNQLNMSREINVVGAAAETPPANLRPKPKITAKKIVPRRRGQRVQLPIRFAFSVAPDLLAGSCTGTATVAIFKGTRRLTRFKRPLKLESGKCITSAKRSFRLRSVRGKRLRVTASVSAASSGFDSARGQTFVKIRR